LASAAGAEGPLARRKSHRVDPLQLSAVAKTDPHGFAGSRRRPPPQPPGMAWACSPTSHLHLRRPRSRRGSESAIFGSHGRTKSAGLW